MKNSYQADKNEGTIPEDQDMQDVVIKPRNGFTDNALRRLVPQTNVREKKAALSQSLQNIGGLRGSGLFRTTSGMPADLVEEGQVCFLTYQGSKS